MYREITKVLEISILVIFLFVIFKRRAIVQCSRETRRKGILINILSNFYDESALSSLIQARATKLNESAPADARVRCSIPLSPPPTRRSPVGRCGPAVRRVALERGESREIDRSFCVAIPRECVCCRRRRCCCCRCYYVA